MLGGTEKTVDVAAIGGMNFQLPRSPKNTVPDDSGDEMVAAHAGLTSSVDAFSKTQASPLSGPSISEGGNVIDAVGETTDYLVLQMEVDDTASPGDLANETLTFQYDEI